MEVFGIGSFFIGVVIVATGFAAYVINGALTRDRRYQLAVGELQPPAAEPEPDLLAPAVDVDPVGTLAILLTYLMVVIGLWLAMFALLVGRS